MRHPILIATIAALTLSCSRTTEISESYPPIWPDYVGVTVPVNIAPMDFGARDEACVKGLKVAVKDEDGRTVLSHRGKYARFSISKWHKVLSANAGKSLTFEVSMLENGVWTSYRPFGMSISRDSIDYGLTYRLIPPGYQSFGHMGLYERDLSSFRQRTLLDTRMVESGCINCHTENRGDPDSYSFHIRGKHSATFMRHDGVEECLNTKTDITGGFFVYPYWHPSGKYIAYSTNATRQSFYTSADKTLEVYDEKSDVIVYCPQTHEILRPEACNTDKFETKPTFSADGLKLYYCVSEPGILPRDSKEMKYSICSIDFNPEDGTFGTKVDTLLSASALDRTFISARPSYDGKYILVASADYGTFPLCHKEADLWIYNLETGEYGPAGGINSDEGAESFHNWSSNSKWAVVSSRRDDGLHTRLYIAHMGPDGLFEKGFLLPQRNPGRYYYELINSYNAPDFTTGPVRFNAQRARKMIVSSERNNVTVR